MNTRRDELLSKLKNVANTKVNKLLNQQNILTEKKQELDECYHKSQIMIKDTTMDADKRKSNILSESKKILHNKQDDNLVTNDKINVTINIAKVNKFITRIGDVCMEMVHCLHLFKLKKSPLTQP